MPAAVYPLIVGQESGDQGQLNGGIVGLLTPRWQGIAFLPLVVESLGGWDERAVHQVKKLASALARTSVEDEGDTWRNLAGEGECSSAVWQDPILPQCIPRGWNSLT